MALKPLPMASRNTAPALRSTVDAAGTTAVGGAKPRLVGKSVIAEINDVRPGMGASIAKHGVKGPAMTRLIKENPGKAAAVAVAGGLGAGIVYDEIVDLAQSAPVEAVRNWAVSVLTQIDELEAAAGLNDPTPDEDGNVGSTAIEQIRVHAGLVREATDIFKDAAAAVGGNNRLLCLMKWLAIDDDLKQIVLDTEM